MKTYFNRQVIVEGEKEVTRKVVEKNGVATVRHENQQVQVTPVGGSPLEKSTKWTLKK